MDRTLTGNNETEISVAEARHDLARWVHQAESGKPVKITRRGKTVAVIVAAQDYAASQQAKPRKGWMDMVLEWRARTGGVELSHEEIDSWRDRNPGRPPWTLEK